MLEDLLSKLTAEIARHNELAAERNTLTRALLDAQVQRASITLQVPPEAQQQLALDAPTDEPACAPAPVAQEPEAVTYDELKVVVLEAAKKVGREAVQGELKALGVARAQELAPAQYGAAHAAFKRLLREQEQAA